MLRSRRLWWMGAVILLLPMVLLIDRPGRDKPVYQAESLSAGDVHVRALRTGRGDTTILMLHGYAESLLAFRNLIQPLGTKYRVVAIDLPGSGRSEVPGAYSLSAMVARVERILDQYISGPVVVVGHSMGGEIAAALALRRPDRIVKVVLIAPAGNGLGFGLTDEPFSDRQQNLAGWSAKTRELLLIPVDDPAWLANPPDLAERAWSDSAGRSATGAVLGEFDFSALRGRFRELAQPTLVIWGTLDPLIPVEIGREIAEELPCGTWVEIGNAWHRPHVEQPERVAREIAAFLAEPKDCTAH